jgi:hypothetical protein
VGLLGDLEDRETDDAALISLARELQDDAKLAVAYMRQGMVPRLKGDYRRELEAFDRALEAARRSGNLKVEALTLGLQVVALSRLGEMGQAAELADQALCAADALGDQDTVVRNLTNVSVFFTESGDIARGAELLARQVEICHGLGYREGEVAGLVNLGYNYVQLGLHPAAVEALERSFRMSDAIGHRLMAAYARLNLGLARIRQGELEAAQQVLADCMTDLCSLGDRFGQAACQGYWALAQERSGAIESASSRYAQARTAFQEMGAAAYAKDASAGMGRCQLAQGQPRQAAQEIAEVWSCLSSGAGVAMEFPVLGFLTCADVFAALEEPGPAGQAVELGHHYLQESAARIENETWRQAYLDNVVEHRQIVKRWKEHNHG